MRELPKLLCQFFDFRSFSLECLGVLASFNLLLFVLRLLLFPHKEDFVVRAELYLLHVVHMEPPVPSQVVEVDAIFLNINQNFRLVCAVNAITLGEGEKTFLVFDSLT